MARVVSYVCDRCSLEVPEGAKVYQIPPITLKGTEGQALFHHPGFPEVCESCKDVFQKALESSWKKVRGRKKLKKTNGPEANVSASTEVEEKDEDEEEDLD